MTETEHAQDRSKLNSKWATRMLLITVVLLLFGAWGFYDALIVYPNRGKSFAAYQQLQYLQAAQRAGKMFDASVIDPVGRLETLKGQDVLQLSEFDRAQREWLTALSVPGMGTLNADHTRIDDPAGELTRLTERFKTEKPKKPLSDYDILMQWVICGVCWAFGLYLIALMLMVKSKVYRWNAETKTITLPDGTNIGPADLDPEDPADLSKWQKFIVLLRPRPGHESLKGPVRFDVFRHAPVEDWLRTIVKSANPELEFPDETKARLAAEAEAEAETEAQSPADESAENPRADNEPADSDDRT
ncbi:MAG: hypothetical protein ACF8LK_00725 [Phycisphaerales bacterium JB041]